MDSHVGAFRTELLAALSRELEIAKRISSGERSNKLLAGHLKKAVGKGFIYEFEELVGFPPEEGVEIWVLLHESFEIETASASSFLDCYEFRDFFAFIGGSC